MSIAKLRKLVAHKSPAFLCKAAGKQSKEHFTARLSHTLRPAPSAANLAKLEKLLPKGSKQLLAFYKLHNGFLLYDDLKSNTVGIELAKIDQMQSMAKRVSEWLDIFDEEEQEEDISNVSEEISKEDEDKARQSELKVEFSEKEHQDKGYFFVEKILKHKY